MINVPHPSSKAKKDAGFTLTELLVVMVVLSLIAAAITPQVMGRLDRSKVRAANLQLQTLGTSLDMFKIDTGRYPTEREGLGALISKPNGVTVWDGPYVKEARSIYDPWENSFAYTVTGSTYQLTSLGADGVSGGTDKDADLIYPDFSEKPIAAKP